ncbi:putative inorganic phosphate cotransporter isoform X2 [Fopius arisanus]|uniref:Inorganic phosphate cotransporter isoform X2 n=1 Tax=Fopius arisanus TaxID=64838 RepID=A0A0C9R4N1_9HYME|nr:PREDICTED: putative inorganic phosphate cotransporter isoform X2 [Fopius arisanus]
MYEKIYRRFIPKWIPSRIIICIMMFTACWTSYMCRLQMSILAVPMIKTAQDKQELSGACVRSAEEAARVNADKNRRSVPFGSIHDPEDFHAIFQRDTNDTGFPGLNGTFRSDSEAPPPAGMHLFSGHPFEWTPFIRGQLISAYSWGNVPGNFIGGVLAQKYGPRQAILWSSLAAGVISLITPILAHVSWMLLAFSRVIIGITGGITFPACHTLVAKWAPPDEKGRFVWTLQGGTFGSIFLFGMISGIAENINWESGWYIPAIMMFVWVIAWYLFAWDSPEEHPGISEAEKNYILESQAGVVQKEKPSLRETPIVKIMTSIPFLCLILCHFGNLFLLFFYQNGMMLYQTKALGFKLTKGGVVAGLPWASRVIFAFFFGWAGDVVKRKQWMSITLLRKTATIFSHLLPGLCLIVVGYLGCSFFWANVFLVLALGFNGAASISNLSNNQDLSPNFAGFLYGIMNSIGCLSGIIISPVVEEVAGKYGNPIEKWRLLFWMGASVCISCMAIFIVGGSGKVQSWNELKPREEEAGGSRK